LFEKIAAIDVGSTSVKYVIAKKKLKNFEILSFGCENIIISDSDSSKQNVIDALAAITKKVHLSNCLVITNLPLEKAIIRNISFPFSDMEKIAEAIPFEAEENIPFKLEDISMDFQILKTVTDTDSTETKVLLAASHYETLTEFLSIFQIAGLTPVFVGLESNSLYECYMQFNSFSDNNMLQIDIGFNKTVLNIISNNQFVYTRCISFGIGIIIRDIAELLSVSNYEALEIFKNLRLDITSLDVNLERHFFKSAGLNKQKMKAILDRTLDVLTEISEQIQLTLKSFALDSGTLELSKILLSGGGAGIIGISSFFTEKLGTATAVLSLPKEFEEKELDRNFQICLGLALSYIKRQNASINFLTGDMLPDFVKTSISKYYLPIFFTGLAVFTLIFNFAISLIITASANTKYNAELKKQFQTLFHKELKDGDPVAEAEKILVQEQKDLNAFKAILPSDHSVIATLNDVLSYFPKDNSFVLKSITINEKDINFEGEIADSAVIDKFKNDLNNSKKFDSVNLGINISGKTGTKFTMSIKLKSVKGKTDK